MQLLFLCRMVGMAYVLVAVRASSEFMLAHTSRLLYVVSRVAFGMSFLLPAQCETQRTED